MFASTRLNIHIKPFLLSKSLFLFCIWYWTHFVTSNCCLFNFATVHQLNADTVHFIESVEPFYDSIGRIICKKDERTISTSEGYVNYKRDLLAALSMNLRNKATDYKSQSTRSLFLMVSFWSLFTFHQM